ncbi:hypothetical protein OROMI_013634 [Orobanche minor]
METHSVNWQNHDELAVIAMKEEYEDVFTFPPQLLPFDHHFRPGFGCVHHPAVSCVDMFLSDPFFTSLDYAPAEALSNPEGFICNSGSDEFGDPNAITQGFGAQEEFVLSTNHGETITFDQQEYSSPVLEDEIISADKTQSNSKNLSKKTISQYFYMPIMQAAKELNVGVTFLKKRCRELGIRRWPHRKLMSLQSLINNVQEMGNLQGEQKQDAIAILEQEKRQMEDIPNKELEEKTKRLRQACFKANYKKRRLMMMDASSSTNYHSPAESHVDEET